MLETLAHRAGLRARGSERKMKNSFLALNQLVNGLGEAVLQSIRDPFGIISRDFRILWANRAMTLIHWRDQEDITGKICYEARDGRQSPCPGCPVEPVLKTGRTYITEQAADFPDGETRWGEVRSYPIRGDDGDIIAVFVFVIETTEKKRDIEQQKQYAALLSQKLNEFTDGEKEVALGNGDIRLSVNLSNRET